MESRLRLTLIVVCLALFLHIVAGSECPPCFSNRPICPPLVISSCKAGVGRDRCGCCIVCLKAENERCGETFGECGTGLICFPEKEGTSKGICINETFPTTRRPSEATGSTNPTVSTQSENLIAPTATADTGRTKPRNNTNTTAVVSVMSVEEDPDNCPSPCSLDYCSDNRNKMCSVNSSEILGDEHGFDVKPNCHVTTCKACFFVEDFDPPCTLCRHGYQCLLHYGRCMKAYIRQVKVKPLGKVNGLQKGKVLCKIPNASSSPRN